MRNHLIFAALLLLFSTTANTQIVNRFRDSTIFYNKVQFDSIIRITEGAGNGKVLTSDANGVASWQNGIVFANGLTNIGDTVILGGILYESTAVDFSPNIQFIYFGSTDSSRGFYIGNLLDDGTSIVGANDIDRVFFYGANDTGSYEISTQIADSTGFPTADVNVKNDGCVYGLFNFDNGGKKTANIYYALDDGSTVTDISRLEANKYDVHGRHLIDSTGVSFNYNGFHANDTYTQLEYNKLAEDDQTTGTLWVLDANGATYYVGGSVIFRIGNTIPTYADDAAAAAGGVAVNQVYKTTTGGSTFLKIRQ